MNAPVTLINFTLICKNHIIMSTKVSGFTPIPATLTALKSVVINIDKSYLKIVGWGVGYLANVGANMSKLLITYNKDCISNLDTWNAAKKTVGFSGPCEGLDKKALVIPPIGTPGSTTGSNTGGTTGGNTTSNSNVI
mmetsp:Transcript_9158/g.1342  ORF Transcript_9158/g.1342 Transcript_9158/m.1342 type:complete len:137 (+) Transcript_9158:1608-2018(+)